MRATIIALCLVFVLAVGVHGQDIRGNTPLHNAAGGGSFGSDEPDPALIEAGADVNARDNNGNTPLYDPHNADIARLLLDAGGTL